MTDEEHKFKDILLPSWTPSFSREKVLLYFLDLEVCCSLSISETVGLLRVRTVFKFCLCLFPFRNSW